MDYFKTMDDFSCKNKNKETAFDFRTLSKADRDEVVEDMQVLKLYLTEKIQTLLFHDYAILIINEFRIGKLTCTARKHKNV